MIASKTESDESDIGSVETALPYSASKVELNRQVCSRKSQPVGP
jgi:hypothetical protein